MSVAKRFVLLLLAGVVGLGAYVAMTVKLPRWRPLVALGPRESIFVRDVRVFTATDAGVLEHQDVTVAEGRIAAIAASGGTAPAGARVIDGAGKTLLPGLFDAHVHVGATPAPPWYLALPDPAHNLEAYLYGGVTTVASMGDAPKVVATLRRRMEDGSLVGPRIVCPGSPITRTGGHPEASKKALVPVLLQLGLPEFSVQIDSPADGAAVVERQLSAGADFVKLVADDLPGGLPHLEAAHVAAITAAAHGRHRKVAAHIGTAADAVLTVENGIDLLNHGPNRGPLTEGQAMRIAAARVPVIPTLVIFERVAQLADRHVAFGPLDRAIEAPELLAQLSDESLRSHAALPFLAGWIEEIRASRPHRAAAVGALHRAGVPLFVGTDSSIFGNVAGASIHQEMRLLVAAGVPPREVLHGATVRPAIFFFERPDFGTVERGKIADLLLVEGKPDEDIAATERIALVLQGGRVVTRK